MKSEEQVNLNRIIYKLIRARYDNMEASAKCNGEAVRECIYLAVRENGKLIADTLKVELDEESMIESAKDFSANNVKWFLNSLELEDKQISDDEFFARVEGLASKYLKRDTVVGLSNSLCFQEDLSAFKKGKATNYDKRLFLLDLKTYLSPSEEFDNEGRMTDEYKRVCDDIKELQRCVCFGHPLVARTEEEAVMDGFY
ncbi:hypothetical protein P5E67_00635 [Vibrio parahaemolyticus]|nr:hypothetical protein [Vibrio parahaemolyticus]